ncbi:MAG TPA: PAS domain S-box protein [Anaeromyxobacter sp.]|nr:PAS domain S-box protein [Anaeromyxobacter sp.]
MRPDRDDAVAVEREALLRLLGESAPDVLFRIRAGSPPAFEYVSPAVAGVTGYSAEEFYADPELGLRIVHPDDRHLAADPSLVESRPEGQVIRWVRKDGRVVHVESRGTVLRDATGAVIAFEGIVRDVTARVRAEEALRESEARLRSVFAAMAEGVVIFDTEGRIVDCNASAERILGLPRERIVGRTSHENWHVLRSDGTPFPPSEYPANRTLRTGQPVRNELLGMIQRDGMVRWLAMSSEPLRLGDAARPHGVLTSFADMTAERHAWVEVRRREAQLRLAMECAGHAYWELDVRRGELRPEGRVGIEAEPGGSADRWMALVHPEDRARARADLEAHVEGRTAVFSSEYRMPAPDGGWRWAQLSGRATARDETGRATHLAGTITDVTEARRLQERLRHTDRLAGVGTLAAGVAHEVNNPLAYVWANLIAVDEALAALAPGVPADPARIEDLRRAVRDAMDGAARVRGIVQALRQFAQPARGEERRPVDVKAELEAAIGIARNEIAHRAQLHVDVPDGLPPVRAAPHELGQVFVNLLVNAAQAIPEGRAGENEIRVSARAEADRVVVEVHDTGAGIPAADLPRVFDPFFTTKPVGAGTGLGLSVCHGIVTAIGGTIDVESPPGAGTTFRVRLPILRAEAAREPPRPTPAPAPKRGRVLVLDDEALVGKSLARLLSAHEVTVLTSPVEVLQRAAAGERWDVVLCDLMMPEMSGMELEERLQAEAPDLVSHIVYLTGGAFTERSRAFLEAGRPHLDKPVDPVDLRARVAERVAAAERKG